MSNRRRPKAAGQKSRVFWSDAEKKAVIERALELRVERPDLAGLPLLRQSMLVLPSDRRRHVIAMSQVAWFEPGMATAIKHREDTRRVLPEMEDWKGRSLEFAKLNLKILGEMSERTDNVERSIGDLIAETRDLLSVVRGMMKLHIDIHSLHDGILKELRLHTRLMGRLVSDLGSDPVLQDEDEDERPSVPLPPPDKEPPPHIAASRASKLRIGVVGPDAQQFNHIGRRIGQKASLNLIDRGHLKGKLPACDWFILTRHVEHRWWDKALSSVDRSRVIRISTGGIETIVNTIDRLARGMGEPSYAHN